MIKKCRAEKYAPAFLLIKQPGSLQRHVRPCEGKGGKDRLEMTKLPDLWNIEQYLFQIGLFIYIV